MLFKDDDPAAAAAQRPLAKAKVSPTARRKAISRRTEDGQPVHSFRTLLHDLANLTRNNVRFGDARPTTILSRPTPIQTRAFDLLAKLADHPAHRVVELLPLAWKARKDAAARVMTAVAA